MEKDKRSKSQKEDDSMSALAQYLENNREQAYAFATANTKRDKQGHPVIPRDDEWVNETEWDELFDILKKRGQTEK